MPIGSHGVINVDLIAPGRWRARSRYRADDGLLRQIERFGKTKNAAQLSLQKALLEAEPSTRRDISKSTHLDDLATRFLQTKSHRAPRTIDTYRQTVEFHIRPKLGALTVAEATTDRLGRFIQSVQDESGAGAAKACRAVLSGMMALAARADAVRVNPIREVASIEHARAGAVPLAATDLPRFLEAIRIDRRLVELDDVALLEFLAGTGCRIGEACALRWEALDLDVGTARIEANVVRARQVGLIRQTHTKTDAGRRTLFLPSWLVERLRERLATRGIATELVFPSAHGHLRDPRNTSRGLADARNRIGFPDLTSHSFRKGIASALDAAGLSAREIADHLGHANPSLTQDVYMTKNAGSVKAAQALDSLLPATPTVSAGFVRGGHAKRENPGSKGPKSRALSSEGGTRTRDTTIMSRVL
jgi:integrase